ncbi:MAG: hypothetical protein K2X03_31445 [Bryobacteraceae bacterium]|nr:hypothetical protein [Bryobacteraceae bacterium]
MLSRGARLSIGGRTVLVASLVDILKSKRAANRPRDLAVLDVLEKTLEASGKKARHTSRKARNDAPGK